MIIEGFVKAGGTEMVAGEVSDFNGKLRASIRIFVPSAEVEGDFIRTTKGISVPVEHFAEVRDGIHKVFEVAGNRVVAKIEAGREPVQIATTEFHGQRVDVRHYYTNSSGELKPSKKGITIPVAQLSELADLADRIAKAIGDGVEG